MILYNIGEVTDRTIHYFSYYSPRPKNDTRLFITPIFAHSALRSFSRTHTPLIIPFFFLRSVTISPSHFLPLSLPRLLSRLPRESTKSSEHTFSLINFLHFSLSLSFILPLFRYFHPVPLARAFVDSSRDLNALD